jgi:hypothetical protein
VDPPHKRFQCTPDVFYAIGTPDFPKMFEAARVSPVAYLGVADSMHIELPGHATVDAALAGATGKGPEEFTLYEIRPIGRFKQTRGVEAVE